jgi:hypothetical protein
VCSASCCKRLSTIAWQGASKEGKQRPEEENEELHVQIMAGSVEDVRVPLRYRMLLPELDDFAVARVFRCRP